MHCENCFESDLLGAKRAVFEFQLNRIFFFLPGDGSLAANMSLEGIAWFLIKSISEQFIAIGLFLSRLNLIDITIFLCVCN
jgi:hypothetical protein